MPMLALKFSRSGRMAATALEQKGLTQYGVKFFAIFIQQTGVRMFINKSDGEPAMKALKDAVAKALDGVESNFTRIVSGSPPSKRCHRVDSEDVEGTDESDEVCTGEQAGTTHDDPILTWMPTSECDTIARFRKGPDVKTLWE